MIQPPGTAAMMSMGAMGMGVMTRTMHSAAPPPSYAQQPYVMPQGPYHQSQSQSQMQSQSQSQMQSQQAAPPGLSSSAGKPVLFFSQYCRFSTEILQALTKKGLRNRFVLVCVDTHRMQVPAFVDRVPVILTPTRDLLSDDAVSDFIASMEGLACGPVAAEFARGDFQFVNEQENSQQQTDAVFSYLSIEGLPPDQFPRITTPNNDSLHSGSDATSGGGGGGASMGMGMGRGSGSGTPSLENLIADRDQSLHSWWQSQRREPTPA